MVWVSGRDGQIRTADLSLRRRPLYPSELRPHLIAIILALKHMKLDLSRRAFVGSLAAGITAAAADDGWVELFDGKSLQGWRPSENKASWRVVNGQLAADG